MPGCTNDLLVKPLRDRGFRVGKDVFIAFSPERIDPGVPDHAPERTPRVVGGYTKGCSERASTFLRHTAGALHLVSSPDAAEMTKLLENTFRAVNIALANEFATAARELKVDIMEIIAAASTKPYGFMPFFPGAGVGGHCIPCDPHYLLWQLRSRRASSPVVEAAMNAIAARPREVVAHARRILADCGKPLRGARLVMLGVSYKAGLGDIRESPALAIIEMLADEGAHVSYSDPYVEMIHTPAAGQLFHLPEPGGERVGPGGRPHRPPERRSRLAGQPAGGPGHHIPADLPRQPKAPNRHHAAKAMRTVHRPRKPKETSNRHPCSQSDADRAQTAQAEGNAQPSSCSQSDADRAQTAQAEGQDNV